MYEEARKIGQLTGEMSCTLKIVKKLKGMGFTVKQVLKTIELPEDAVIVENALECFMPPQDKEELIPLKEPQRLTCEQWAKHTPYENKLELFDEQALTDLRERENMIIALSYNIGLEQLC